MSDKDKKISELKKKLEELENKYYQMDIELFHSAEGRRIYDELLLEMAEIKRQILVVRGPDYTNGVLDLYFNSDYDRVGVVCENFDIAIAGTGRVIGNVRITYDDMRDNFLGNIGYKLSHQYRGNGYMLQVLEILKKPMLDKGLEKPIITTAPGNTASIRTIEKFGGKRIENDDWYNIYEVDLTEKTGKSKWTIWGDIIVFI